MSDLVQHLVNGVSAGTIYALVALGYTMVYGVLRLINFAHGDVMMVGVYLGYGVARELAPAARTSLGGVLLVFLAAMVGCAALGLFIERVAYRPLRDKPRLTSLITAIGISFTLSYGAQLDLGFLPGAAPRAFPELIQPEEWLIVGDRDIVLWNWQVLSLGIAVSLMMALQGLVYRTRFGLAMRAVSFDHRVAGLMGIPTDRVIAWTFALGSALAAGAGILYAIKDTAVQPLMGLYIGLKAFIAAVIGGIGSVPGALVGGLLLGLLEELVVGLAASSFRDAVAFAALIAVLLVRPAGLFGRVVPEKV
ncbi:MAG: branched-chain amino acid ABC transporter permease [Deltaproteobacteria bacterium]|nr:branched-chain amino acid ABC transporter permease [Deltaproteobacteria bacterium]